MCTNKKESGGGEQLYISRPLTRLPHNDHFVFILIIVLFSPPLESFSLKRAPHLQLYPGDFSQVVLSPLQALRVDLVQFADYKCSLETFLLPDGGGPVTFTVGRVFLPVATTTLS